MKFADGKERTIQHMVSTTFWHPEGTPISAQQFMELLFGKLPEFFKSEAELRELWSAPDTRKRLLQVKICTTPPRLVIESPLAGDCSGGL